MKTSKSGSVTGAALIVAVVLTLTLASLMSWVHTEARVTRRSVLETKARYAAEASAEFALAQMRATMERSPLVTTGMFTAEGSAPVKPDTTLLGTTASTALRNLGTVDGGATYQLLNNVVGSVTEALATSSSTTTSTGGTGRHHLEAVNLVVSPLSAPYEQWMSPTNPLYADDPLRGHRIPVRDVRIYASARATDSVRGESTMAYSVTTLQIRSVSLFDYISYYNLDLELSPAAGMDVYGPIHTNRNFYVQGGSRDTETNFHGVVTAAGGIFHGRAPGVALSTNPGAVAFAGPGDTLVPMKQGSSWLDSANSAWAGRATELWAGNVMTGAHGIVPSLPAPIPVDDPATPVDQLSNAARVLIEPATPNASAPEMELLKYGAKASLVFHLATTTTTTIVGTGESAREVTVNTVTPKAYRYVRDDANGPYTRLDGESLRKFRREELSVPGNLWTYHEFYDRRWDRTVKSADLDVGRLKELIEESSLASEWTNGDTEFNPATDWNGVVYIEHANTTDAAVRLVNGADVPDLPTSANGNAKGFTLATNAPLYIWGNYNADGNLPSEARDIQNPDDSSEPPAALVADAVTVLSANWQDANSTAGIDTRRASQTEIAAAVIGGIVPSANGEYSGGWHNMVRMLEDWRGVKLAFRSSMIVLYTSEIADTPWAGQSPIYEPPSRLFGWNKLFQDGVKPPETVPNQTMRRISSRIISEQEFTAAIAALGVTP